MTRKWLHSLAFGKPHVFWFEGGWVPLLSSSHPPGCPSAAKLLHLLQILFKGDPCEP